MFRLSVFQNYLCSIVLLRKAWIKKSKYEHVWAIVNFALAIPIILDMKFHFLKGYYSTFYFLPTIVWWLEGLLCVIMFFNVLAHLYLYYWLKTAKPYFIPASWTKLLNLPTEGEEGRHWECYQDQDSQPDRFVDYLPYHSWHGRMIDWISSLSKRKPMVNTRPYPRKPGALRMRRQAFDDSMETPLKTKEDLTEYLRRKNDEAEKFKIMNRPLTNYKYGIPRGTLEYDLQLLREHIYQPYCNTPSPLDDVPPSGCSQNVWDNYRVTEQMLSVWCERLRKWICETIVVRLVEGIDAVNERLCELGLIDFQIGVANLFAIQQLSMMTPNIPTMKTIIPYLEVALNQEYLVQRLKELACGGCMRDYRWNGGGKAWSKELPTDCNIVFHLFITYLDAVMPCDTQSLKKKSFSSSYVKKVPEKPVFRKGLHYIYKSKDDPAHYTVIIDEEVYGLPKGQNNLFGAVAFLLYHLKVKENKVIGRVNLGPSGLNILFLFD